MNNTIGQLPKLALALFLCSLCSALLVSAQPLPQSSQPQEQSPSTQSPSNDANKAQPSAFPAATSAAPAPVDNELPDAPSPVQPVQQNQDSSSVQTQNSDSVPSGAAGAKAPTLRGAPASRTVGAAIAPAKQKQRRSLLIKAGLVAGACVAVGSAFALSKGSPSKPPGAP